MTVARSPAERDVPAWLREMGVEEFGPRIAQMAAERPPHSPTYATLFADLLQSGNGG